jgi:hypothetical protein
MIRLVTGPLGTGKSYYAVRKSVGSLLQGKMVATNFDMRADWVDQAVRHGHLFKNSAKLDERVERFQKRYFRIHTMEELRKLRVRPEPPFAREVEADRWQVKEGSLVVILDEAHRWLNARDWTREGREHLLEFFALARKRGMEVYLIAHRKENLDVQTRELFEDHIRLTNLKRSARVLGIPIIPFNYFIAGWENHAYEEVVKTERYKLGWEKRLYDTMDTVSFTEGEEGDDGALWLPREATDLAPDVGGESAQPATAAPAPAGAPPAPLAPPSGYPNAPDPAL